jgi:endonuclease III
VTDRAEQELGPDVDFARRAHLLLRRHGQLLCRRSAPECGACPLARGCPTGTPQPRKLAKVKRGGRSIGA